MFSAGELVDIDVDISNACEGSNCFSMRTPGSLARRFLILASRSTAGIFFEVETSGLVTCSQRLAMTMV